MKSELGGGARAAWWAALFGASVLAGVAVLDTSGAAADRNRDGYTHGYTHGYAHGYTHGHTRGYTHGYRDGYTEGDTESQSYSLPFGETEAKLEADFQKIPNAQQAESHVKAITASPHMAGTEGSHKVAEWLREQYEGYGFDAKIVTYSAWMPQPKEIKLELVEPEKKALGTQEQPFAEDKDSQNKQLMPAFNAYSASGDVTAPVVYVNYGTQDDYKQLDAMGVDVAGKIVLARYGKSYRGIKAKIAEERKAVGVLIYSDPYDDGYDAGDVFPKGPWRPMSGIQRGSVVYTQIYPGDPLTPGVAATPDAKRIAPEQAASLPKIPTLPINAQDASSILSNLTAGKVPQRVAGRLAVYLPQWAGRDGAFESGDGLPAEEFIRRDREVTGNGRQRVGAVGESPRRVGVWGGGSEQRHDGDAGDGAGAG